MLQHPDAAAKVVAADTGDLVKTEDRQMGNIDAVFLDQRGKPAVDVTGCAPCRKSDDGIGFFFYRAEQHLRTGFGEFLGGCDGQIIRLIHVRSFHSIPSTV